MSKTKAQHIARVRGIPEPIEITDDAANMIRQLQDEKREIEAEATKWHDRAREAATEVGELQARIAELESDPFRIGSCDLCARVDVVSNVFPGEACPTCDLRERNTRLKSRIEDFQELVRELEGASGVGEVGCPQCGAVGVPCPPHCPEAKKAAGQYAPRDCKP